MTREEKKNLFMSVQEKVFDFACPGRKDDSPAAFVMRNSPVEGDEYAESWYMFFRIQQDEAKALIEICKGLKELRKENVQVSGIEVPSFQCYAFDNLPDGGECFDESAPSFGLSEKRLEQWEGADSDPVRHDTLFMSIEEDGVAVRSYDHYSDEQHYAKIYASDLEQIAAGPKQAQTSSPS